MVRHIPGTGHVVEVQRPLSYPDGTTVGGVVVIEYGPRNHGPAARHHDRATAGPSVVCEFVTQHHYGTGHAFFSRIVNNLNWGLCVTGKPRKVHRTASRGAHGPRVITELAHLHGQEPRVGRVLVQHSGIGKVAGDVVLESGILEQDTAPLDTEYVWTFDVKES